MPQPFITPEHLRVRNALRVAGPIVFLVGLILTVIGAASLFVNSGSFTPENYFWLGFVGMPLMFVGGACSMYGFMGAMARYAAREGVPVGVDAINYAAEGTQLGITTAARAIAAGVRQGLSEPLPGRTCARCQSPNDADARFCKTCGAALTAS